MGNFEEAWSDVWDVNLSVNGLGVEAVTYKPRVGSTRGIYAEVTRNPPATPQELNQGLTPSFIVTVRNSATTGISSTELDIGGDRISVAQMVGGTAEDILIPKPDAHDDTTLTFRIGKK